MKVFFQVCPKVDKIYLFLAKKGFFSTFCPKVDKTYFFQDGKTEKKTGGKNHLEKNCQPCYKPRNHKDERKNTRTEKMECPFVLKFKATSDGQALTVFHMNNKSTRTAQTSAKGAQFLDYHQNPS